jgi:TonB family protein
VETPPAPAPSEPPATVAPARALLSIASNPSGARVTIGKAGRGVTPLRLELPTGKLSVAVEKEGFKPWRRDVILFSRGLTLEARLDRLVMETPPAPKPTPTPTPPGVKAGDLVALGPDVTPPKRVAGGSPRVPSGSKQKLTGSVVVEFVIDEDGRVRDERVVESAGNALDASCLEAVRAWRYEPATTQGVKVKVLQRSKFTFLK